MGRKTLVKLLVCTALFVSAVLPLAGCQGPTAEEAVHAFLSYIQSGEYGAAYEMLHSSVVYDETRGQEDAAAGRSQSAKRVDAEQFQSAYTARFELLEISGFTYAITRRVEGDAICLYDYTLQYESPLLEDTPMAFQISVRRENNRWTIEWTPALMFPNMDWGDSIRTGTTAAKRGEILADGVVYAQTVNAISVLAVKEKIEDEAQFARQAAELLGMPAENITKTLDKTKGDFAILQQLYPDQYTETLEEQLLLIPGVSIDKSNFGTLRYYPKGASLAHMIGYVGYASEKDLEELTGDAKGNEIYTTDSRVGKTGLERKFEKELRGADGYLIYICTADGQNKQTLYKRPAQDGLDVQLNINPDLQDRAETMLKYSLYGDHTAGAVVVLNPKTGAVEVMTSYPGYDLNQFSRGISEKDYQALLDQANTPMFNRLTQGRYPPGSIFKPFTAAAALESGAMTPSTTFPGREEIVEDVWLPSNSGEFGPWGYSSIKRVELNNRHWPLNMHNGMIDSDNIYFAYAALRTGIDAFSQFGAGLGMDEAIPFDVPVSASQLKNTDSVWSPMLLAESAYGQGEVLMTPLQAAALFGAFANNGDIMETQLVKGLYRTEGAHYIAERASEPRVWKEDVVDANSLSTISPMLRAVIEEGTGKPLRPVNTPVAGKTGTAQIGNDRRREISWFVGYRADAEEPRLVLVMLELPAKSELASVKFDIGRTLLNLKTAQE